jgi:hypothetical protein
MPYHVVEFVSTPNPHAIKVVVQPSPAPAGPRSYRVPPPADADPLGAAILAIPGIRNVLLHDGWLTVGKDPGASWSDIKPALRRLLEAHPNSP